MKEKYQKITEKFKLKKQTKELIKKQIELFYTYNTDENKKSEINENVLLNKNNLIHGSRADLKTLEIISKTGLIASEFYQNLNQNKKKPYVVELWEINETITLQNWIKKYTGVTIDFKNREGNVYKSIISSFENIQEHIQKEKNFRDYIIYQNQEQRFVPNDIIDNEATVAFIIEFTNDDELIKNDIFNKEFNQKTLQDLLPKWFYKKYMKNRNFDNYETGREKAIIFGIPLSMIKGIMVSRNIEKEIKYISKIRELFPNCYICNIDGKII